jgi:callose synthase
MTRGGISKASKGINLSEDIFAGYNNVLRGGSVAFKEYVQVGKGRDVGMQQIYKFEAKLSQGAAEQSLSRDVYRVAQRLDFFRLLAMYFGGIGHYFGNVLTVFTIHLLVYLMLGLALFDCEKIGDREITPTGTLQMLLGGMGLLQTLPLLATLGVEKGWWNAFLELSGVFITVSLSLSLSL